MRGTEKKQWRCSSVHVPYGLCVIMVGHRYACAAGYTLFWWQGWHASAVQAHHPPYLHDGPSSSSNSVVVLPSILMFTGFVLTTVCGYMLICRHTILFCDADFKTANCKQVAAAHYCPMCVLHCFQAIWRTGIFTNAAEIKIPVSGKIAP